MSFSRVVCLTALASIVTAQMVSEPGASPGVEIIDISQNGPQFASAFPFVATSPKDDNLVAVAWRLYSLPIDTNAPKGSRTADCHIAISHDGGVTFRDTNLMTVLRTGRSATMPELWYCNAPWAAFGPDGIVYAGGALFTANGVTGPEPKQGRQMVAVSRDGGATWSKGVPGLTVDKFAPGVTGIERGKEPQDTPWDGAKGLADTATGTFFSTAQGYLAASSDKGLNFGTVYQPAAAKEWPGRGADFAAAQGSVVAVYFAGSTPVMGRKCPCLVFGISKDLGRRFTYNLIADSTEVNPTGRVRYPQVAADPVHSGHFAVTGFTPDHRNLKIFFTEDDGKTWKSAEPQPPPPGLPPVSSADMPGLGYTSDGRILAAWRGFRAAGAYNVFAAMLDYGKFGPTIKISPEASPYPPLVQMGNYSLGGGDFTTPITGGSKFAHIAFPYSPGGVVQRTYYARIALDRMKP
ncbi:MAG: hypothetical protein JO307_00490 [Bryobacterales bacterium]|nr:hypothetical protein [Bryobacterales bacterium]MBV9400621.1 hypothetical protein [Bryobacterales bacterium]